MDLHDCDFSKDCVFCFEEKIEELEKKVEQLQQDLAQVEANRDSLLLRVEEGEDEIEKLKQDVRIYRNG